MSELDFDEEPGAEPLVPIEPPWRRPVDYALSAGERGMWTLPGKVPVPVATAAGVCIRLSVEPGSGESFRLGFRPENVADAPLLTEASLTPERDTPVTLWAQGAVGGESLVVSVEDDHRARP